MKRQQQQSRRKSRTDERSFVPVLARFDGLCGICDKSYKTGDQIYWCPKTPTTRTMRVHQFCYLQRTRAFRPSFKPSPRESVLERMREADGSHDVHAVLISPTDKGVHDAHAHHQDHDHARVD